MKTKTTLLKFIADVCFKSTWGFILLGASFLCFITFTYYLADYNEKGFVFFRTNIGFLLQKQDGVRSTMWMTAFYFHVTSCILCLIIGPFQFIGYIRHHYSKQHRLAGKIYIFSILVAGAPSGLYMAVFANGGLWAQLGFGVLSFLWIGTTYLAYHHVRNRNFKAHMAWTSRSYALTFSAVTLRMWTPILSVYFPEISHDTITASTAWLNWIPNLLIVEMIIRFAPKRL